MHDVDAGLFAYTHAAVRKDSHHDQLLDFLDFRDKRTGTLPRELVFDSTFTTCANLQMLTERGIAFLALRRRSGKMVAALQERPRSEWKRIRLTNVGGTFRTPRILEEKVRVRGYKQPLRQVAITDLGHDKPTLLITTQMKVSAAKLIYRYARRMIVEDKLADAIGFFHPDALSSLVPLKIDIDLQLTLMASSFSCLLAKPCPPPEILLNISFCTG